MSEPPEENAWSCPDAHPPSISMDWEQHRVAILLKNARVKLVAILPTTQHRKGAVLNAPGLTGRPDSATPTRLYSVDCSELRWTAKPAAVTPSPALY